MKPSITRLNIFLILPSLLIFSCMSDDFSRREYKPGDKVVVRPTKKDLVKKREVKLNRTNTGSFRNMARKRELKREGYDRIVENNFRDTRSRPFSTLAVDVDTASYSNTRRFLNQGKIPPKDAVRIEELVNYFNYNYPEPKQSRPFSTVVEVGPAPWAKERLLVHIGIKGKMIDPEMIPPRNLVFLLDVSGSMKTRYKLPLLKQSLKLLIRKLRPEDRVSIVTYAGKSGVVLKPTPGNKRKVILRALKRLRAKGKTNGGAGIKTAYKLARQNYNEEGINRIILCTDGDFNVGATNRKNLINMIENERDSGVFLTVLGFGMGNYKDSRMEQLANKGNGNYAYIDSFSEARKVLVEEAGATLIPIAKDVKIQVKFNPVKVKSYRLIGYENRKLKKDDFSNDKKDAGEIGAGHTVTALYEIIPRGPKAPAKSQFRKLRKPKFRYIDVDKYKPNELKTDILTVRIRYKDLNENASKLLSFPVKKYKKSLKKTSSNFRFSASVAAFGMLLRDSPHKGKANFNMVARLARRSRGKDRSGYRAQFIRLVRLAETVKDD